MDRSQFLGHFNLEARRESAVPSTARPESKRENAISDEALAQIARLKRKRKLQTSRRNLKIAQGLRTCRELRDMTRNEFAEAIGITR